MTQERAARLLDRSPASLSEYENGHRAIRPRDLAQILDGYGVSDAKVRAHLLELAGKGRQEGWWQGFDERLEAGIIDFASMESDASRVGLYDPQLVPGLLQTEDYARAVISGSGEDMRSSRDIDVEVEFRMRRQHILERADPPRLTVVLGEGALLLRVGGPAIMEGQLRYLLAMAARPEIDLRVLPFGAGVHPGTNGAFTIMDLGVGQEELQVVTVHSLTRSWYIDETPDIEHYRKVFSRLTRMAMSESDTVAMIQRIVSIYE